MKIRAFLPEILGPGADVTDAAAWPLPQSIEWMPSGAHTIVALVGDIVQEVTVSCVPEDAPRLDAQLQSQLEKSSKGEQSRPYVDFDHKGNEAAAIPIRIFWDDGIRLEVSWTDSGAEAVRGRNYSYFSPEFILSDDGTIAALPDLGPIGSLVNTPAFQTIEKIAAKAGGDNNQQRKNAMEKLLAALVEAQILASAEASDEDAASAVRAAFAKMRTDLETAQAKLNEVQAAHDGAQAKLAEAEKARVETTVQAAISSGRIKAEIKDKWVQALLADPQAQELLDAIEPPKPPSARGIPPSQLPEGTKKPELKGLARLLAAAAAKSQNQ